MPVEYGEVGIKNGSWNGNTLQKDTPQTGSARGETNAPHSNVLENQYLKGDSYPKGYYPTLNYPSKNELSLQAYLQVIFRYRYLIFLVSAIIVSLTALITHKMPRTYTATAVVNIGSYLPPTKGPMTQFLQAETAKWTYVNNQLALLKSHAIAKKAFRIDWHIQEYIAGPNFRTAARFTKDGDPIEYEPDIAAIDRYLGLISFEQLERTTLVEITAAAAFPAMAARVANAHAQAFTELVREQRVSIVNVNVEFLKPRLTETKQTVSETQRKLLKFAQKHAINIITASGSNSPANGRLLSLVNNLSRAVLDRATAEAELRETGFSQRGTRYNFNSVVIDNYLKLQKLRNEENILRKVFRSNKHYKRVEVRQEMNIIKQGLELSAKQFYKKAKIKYKASLEREKLLRKELDNSKVEDRERTQATVQFNILKAENDAAKMVHQQVARRLEDALINAKSEQETVTLLDNAVPPLGPSSPNTTFNLLLACVLGPLMGIGLAFILDFFNNSIQTADYITSTLNLAMLGYIPSFSRKRAGSVHGSSPEDDHVEPNHLSQKKGSLSNQEYPIEKIPTLRLSNIADLCDEFWPDDHETVIVETDLLIAASSPMSGESEAFRHLRTILTYSDENSPKVILVTSGQKEDGKTTIASNLAVSIAQASQRTLLIDGDLRLPAVHKQFGLSRNTLGLADCLLGTCGYDEAIIRCSLPNLSLLLAGRPAESPADLIASASTVELLEHLTKDPQFDRIIIDSPPITRVADALLFSRLVDGVLLVVRSGRTPKPVAESSVTRLRQMDAPILGAVLNDIKKTQNYRQAEYYYINKPYR